LVLMGVIRHIWYVCWHSDLSHGLILAATEDDSRSQFPYHSCVLEGLDLSCSYGLHYICPQNVDTCSVYLLEYIASLLCPFASLRATSRFKIDNGQYNNHYIVVDCGEIIVVFYRQADCSRIPLGL